MGIGFHPAIGFAVQCSDLIVVARAHLRFALCLVILAAMKAEAQDRARDAPFSCEPVVTGSIVFRGFALGNYPPGSKQLVRFQIEEPFFGVRADLKEIEIPLDLEEAIGRGEERIVASLPGQDGPSWSTENVDQELDKAYLKYLRGLRSGKGPGRILGWSDYEGVPLPGTIIRAVGSEHRYETRPLFEEMPDISLPPYMLVVSFGLIDIATEHGPIEIATGTHRMARDAAIQSVESGECDVHPILLEIGDVLIRHPWALHRGTPNRTHIPRALASVRYVRRWYADESREGNAIPKAIWQSLTAEQRALMRFPIAR